MDIQNLMDDIVCAVQPLLGKGESAAYIPSLASVDPTRFGISVATRDGVVFSAGYAGTPFSIQSISKVFALALELARDGDGIWNRVFCEPSGNPFNSLFQLEYEDGIPRNPFINAGALMVTDRLLTIADGGPSAVRNLVRQESGNFRIDYDANVADSEAMNGHRNISLAHFL